MNKELMYRVADAIERENVRGTHCRLNMNIYMARDDCGTAACVAGFAVLESMGRYDQYESEAFHLGMKILDLDESEARHLFLGSNTWLLEGIPLGRINENRELVPAALRWMADNDKIDWHAGLNAACEARGKDAA